MNCCLPVYLDCPKCQCKAAANEREIEKKIRELSNVLRNCRDIADRILREQCGVKPKTPCQDIQDMRQDPCQPCYKKNQIFIKWNKK